MELYRHVCNTTPDKLYNVVHEFVLQHYADPKLRNLHVIRHGTQLIIYGNDLPIGHVDALPLNDVRLDVRVIAYQSNDPATLFDNDAVHAFMSALADQLREWYGADDIQTRRTVSMGADTAGNASKQSPWASGSFYLILFVVVALTVAIISNIVPWYALPIVLIATILIVPILGIFQSLNDGTLSEKGFIKVIVESYKRLPLLNRNNK